MVAAAAVIVMVVEAEAYQIPDVKEEEYDTN